ncbi:unnamed protein product [Sphagnum balticum]
MRPPAIHRVTHTVIASITAAATLHRLRLRHCGVACKCAASPGTSRRPIRPFAMHSSRPLPTRDHGAQTFVNTLSGGGSGAVQPTPYDRPTVNVADVQSTFITFLAPLDNVDNLWIADIGALVRDKSTASAIPLTNVTDRAITIVSMLSPSANPLNATTILIAMSTNKPDTIILGVNDRDTSYFDPYTANLRTGQMEKIFDNKRFDQLYFDGNLQLRFALETLGDGGQIYWQYTNGSLNRTTSWQFYRQFDAEDIQNSHPLGFDKTNTRMYWTDSTGRDLGTEFIE